MTETFRPKQIEKSEITSTNYYASQYQLEVVSRTYKAGNYDYTVMHEFNVKNIEAGCEVYAYGLCIDMTVRMLLDGQHCDHCICDDCYKAMDELPINNVFVPIVASELKITERMKLPVNCKADDTNDHVFLISVDTCMCQKVEISDHNYDGDGAINGATNWFTSKRDHNTGRLIYRDDWQRLPIS